MGMREAGRDDGVEEKNGQGRRRRRDVRMKDEAVGARKVKGKMG